MKKTQKKIAGIKTKKKAKGREKRQKVRNDLHEYLEKQ